MPPPKMKNNSPDNFQTPAWALDCLVPYLKKEWWIWEPACGNKNLVFALEKKDFVCYGTDVKNLAQHDFIKWHPQQRFDCIITNPPFSIKEKFLARCYQLRKPFALLMPITTFDSVERRKLMAQYGIEVIFPHKRINFETPNHEKNIAAGKKTSSQFYTAWFTWGLNIGSQLVFTDAKSLDI